MCTNEQQTTKKEQFSQKMTVNGKHIKVDSMTCVLKRLVRRKKQHGS